MLFKRTLCLFLGILSLAFVVGCEPAAPSKAGQDYPAYTSFRNIPGVTVEEIAAIERLQAEKRSFVFGVNPSTEFFITEDGSPAGYSVLLCDWLTTLFGIPFKPEVYEWDGLVAGLKSQTIDFTGEMTATEERRRHYFMTDPIAERIMKRLSIKGDEMLSRIEKQRPLRYVFLDGTSTREQIWPFLRQDSEYILVGNYEDVYRALKDDKADAFLDEGTVETAFEAYGDVVIEVFYPLLFSPVSLTTQTPEFAPVIDVMQKALQNGSTYHLVQLYNQGTADYRRYKLFTQLNAEEKAYIHEHVASNRAIPMAVEYDNYPVAFYNEQEKAWQGIALDVLEEIEQLTGLTFARAHEGRVDWPDLVAMLERGDAAILTELIPSEKRRGHFLWPDTPYLVDKYALLSRADQPDIMLNEILYARVGLTIGTDYAEVFRTWFPDHKNTVEYMSSYEAFDALERGDVDFLMLTQNLLLNATNYLERPGFKINILFDRSYESTFGLHLQDTVLRSIVSKSLRVIDTQNISQNWTHKVFDYRLKMAEAKFPWLVGVSVLTLCTIILLLVLYQNRSMKKRLEKLVQARTAELCEQRDLLEKMSMTDQLTNLPNRRSFNERIHREWRIAIREKVPLSILLMDIDKFKTFNDTYGHQQGDVVLQKVSETIKQALNRPGDFAARWGGEEFIVLLPNTDVLGALKIAESMRGNVEELKIAFSGDVVAKVTISIGVHAQIPLINSSLDRFISIADQLLYKAKEMGRNRVHSA